MIKTVPRNIPAIALFFIQCILMVMDLEKFIIKHENVTLFAPVLAIIALYSWLAPNTKNTYLLVAVFVLDLIFYPITAVPLACLFFLQYIISEKSVTTSPQTTTLTCETTKNSEKTEELQWLILEKLARLKFEPATKQTVEYNYKKFLTALNPNWEQESNFPKSHPESLVSTPEPQDKSTPSKQ
jgi:Zn-dependent M16 (insulinase) family peptidase